MISNCSRLEGCHSYDALEDFKPEINSEQYVLWQIHFIKFHVICNLGPNALSTLARKTTKQLAR